MSLGTTLIQATSAVVIFPQVTPVELPAPSDYSNVDYTFGGKYNGSDRRNDINSYVNSALAGYICPEPRRVNVKMLTHVCTQGPCMTRALGAPRPMRTVMLCGYNDCKL